jgi:4a-hydroxytetrahydrobiopterin dehydratase
LRVSYNRCVVAWSTHDAGGVTRNDLICAAKTDRLLAG